METVPFAQCGHAVLSVVTQNTDHEKSDCHQADCQQDTKPALQAAYLQRNRLGMVSPLGCKPPYDPLRAVFGYVVLKRT